MSVIGCHQDVTSPVITCSVCGLQAALSICPVDHVAANKFCVVQRA